MPSREFSNDVAELRPMSAWLRTSGAALGAASTVIDDAELCANELFANLCDHAFPEGGQHRITMKLAMVGNGLSMAVEDDGIPFDPSAGPLPARPTALSEARPGGHGLVLIRGLARELRYERVGDRNRLTLLFASRP